MILAVAITLLAAPACAPGPAADGPLPEEGEEAVRSVNREYVRAWRANDPEAVMATLAPGAVLVPGGMKPIRGDSAIRAFWWPSDGSQTRVTAYEATVDEVGGSGDRAFLRGRGRLAFDWRSSPDSAWRSVTSSSVWMALLHRCPDGAWRMTHRMWHRVEGP